MTESRICCRVCQRGVQEVGGLQRQNRPGKPGIWVCADHVNRVCCAINECHRTTKRQSDAHRHAEWICPEHWRRYCPPRSARRRAYNAFFRQAHRDGLSHDLADRFWRFWDQLVASARARAAAGAPNVTEINRIMGW